MKLRLDRMTAAACAVFALALAARLRNLSTWDMWADEVQTLWMAQSGEFSFGPTYRTAPLNFLLTGFAIRVLGSSEQSVRMIPFLCGVLTVVLSYVLFQRWVGRRAAIFAMLTLAVSTWHVYWSQTARHFALQTLLVLIATHLFLHYWRSGSRTALLGATASLGLGLLTHSSSGFAIAALLAFVVISWAFPSLVPRPGAGGEVKGRHRWATIFLLALLIGYLPIYFVVGTYLANYTFAWNPPWNIAGSLVFYVPPWLGLAALAGASVLAYEGDPELAILLTALLVVPVVLVIVASRFTIASAAYALPVVVPLAALVGVAADRALVAGSTSARRWTSRFAVAAIFVSQVNDLVLYHTFYNGLKPRWRSALAYVAQHRRTGDVILASEGDVAQYYLGRTNVGWFKPSAPAREQWNSTSESDGVWYVLYTAETGPLAIPPARLASVRAHSSLRALFSLHYGAKDRTIGVFYQSPGDDAP